MEQEAKPKKRPQWTARNRLMDLLARRDHSEKELREKLFDKFPPEEIDAALTFARDKGWLADDSKLANMFAESLRKRNKGIVYVNQYLKKKGLPSIKAEADQELEMALEIANTKYNKFKDPTIADKAKLMRFLASRGFSSDTIRSVLSQFKFKYVNQNRSPLKGIADEEC
jgi:regulatory protein